MNAPLVRRRSLTAAVAAVLLFGLASTVDAEVTTPDDLPDPTSEQLADSVHVWEVNNVHQWSTEGAVHTLETVETEGNETTISLATDILFTPNSWELPDTAADRIDDLVADIPDDAQVQVRGHTDSTPTGKDFDNKELSTRRAEAVADVISKVRSDLHLQVEGLGDSEPAETEKPDDPSTFAANRRVEIRYES